MIAFCEESQCTNYHYYQNFCDLCVNMLLLRCFSLQKELFKSAMELVEESEKSDEITTPTDPNVRLTTEENSEYCQITFISIRVSYDLLTN